MTHAGIISAQLIRVKGAYGQLCTLHGASQEVAICTRRNSSMLSALLGRPSSSFVHWEGTFNIITWALFKNLRSLDVRFW